VADAINREGATQVINSSRSERGWRGRRRIAVLVSIAGVLGIAALGSATTASAATVAGCNAKLTPKGGNPEAKKAKLSFTCNDVIRTYSVGATGKIADYGATSAPFLSCEGTGAGFGCGIKDRAADGTQAPGTTGWNTTTPGASTSATGNPTTCHGFKRVEGNSMAGIPNKNAIVTGPCMQQVAADTKITQGIKLGASACGKNPVKLFVFVGGEPDVVSFLAPGTGGGGGESTTVGEFLQAPVNVNMKAYKSCVTSGTKAKKGKKSAKKSALPATAFPVSCSGSVTPFKGVRGPDADVGFTCTQNIRGFAIYSNKQIDLPGDEPVVTGTNGGGVNESANAQCEGDLPSFGYGCGTVDRQTTTAASATSAGLPNGNTISGGNTANQKMGFDSTPCKRKGEAKPKVWLVVMGEPATSPYGQGSSGSVGEFSSQPFPLAVSGFGKCGGKKKK
jgi:hypothetical protein